MKKIVYLIIIFSLVSCIIPYVHKVKLTDEDLGWITHYKINDSIYYVSNTDDTDTLIVKDIQIWNPNPSLTGKIIFHKFSGCFV